ncbi:MAG: hypothetical protein OXH01_09980, partial [Bacteroidetes bacterium]|nr:hypothetical protein [Bacteroidota bacterium]
MTYDLNRGGDRTTEPADDDVIVGIPASGAPYTTSWSRVKGWIRRALSSTAPGNTPGSPSAGSSSEAARADHDHGITPGTSGGSGWTYDPAGLNDDIDDDTGGDIDFSRQGSGATSNLRGTIRDNAVERSMIANKSINASKLNDNAVTNAKIADDAVDTDQLADDAVTRAKIGSAAVGTTEIGTSAVTTAKIADDAITADKIADGVIPSNTGTSVAAHTPAAGDAELAGIDIGGTDYEIVDRESRDRLHDVEQRVHPIREVPRTWSDITDTSAGWVVDDSLAPTYAGLSFAQTAVSGTAAQFVYVRVPVGARQSNYRFQYTVSGGAQNGETHNRVLGTWSGEQVASDSSWLYYRISFYEGDGFSAGKVQAGGSDSFEWEGSLTKDSVETQLDALGIPQQIDALKNVTRDLHLDGATKLVKNT